MPKINGKPHRKSMKNPKYFRATSMHIRTALQTMFARCLLHMLYLQQILFLKFTTLTMFTTLIILTKFTVENTLTWWAEHCHLDVLDWYVDDGIRESCSSFCLHFQQFQSRSSPSRLRLQQAQRKYSEDDTTVQKQNRKKIVSHKSARFI